jgi:hypothetical protein
MQIKADKTIGYVLLAVGAISIILAACSVFNVFTEATVPPAILEMKDITIPISGGGGMPTAEIEVLSGTEISQITNMMLWFVLMIFIITAGGKLGGLGVKLVRDIKVEVKRED